MASSAAIRVAIEFLAALPIEEVEVLILTGILDRGTGPYSVPPRLAPACHVAGAMAVFREGTQGRTTCEGHVMGYVAAVVQCNDRPCETRYSTTDPPGTGERGQIVETLKGQPPSNCKLQIYGLFGELQMSPARSEHASDHAPEATGSMCRIQRRADGRRYDLVIRT